MSHIYVGQHRLLDPASDSGRHRVQPTFTPYRLLFLLLIGPVVFVLTALLIQFSDNAWILHAAWLGTDTNGVPVVSIGHAASGGGR
jgi:hypothetical protein